MKRLLLLLCLSVAALPLLASGCKMPIENADRDKTPLETTSEQAQFRECETVPAVYGKDNQVFVTLYENAAIPYRWVCNISDPEIIRLVGENTVSGDGVPFAAGDSPGYHQFVLEWVSDGQVILTLENQRIPEYSDGQDAPAECRSFAISRSGEEVTIEETTENDEP